MNYKLSNNIGAKYVVLSYFHRGLFWGVILAWISVISSVSGALITKVFYLDKRKNIVVKNSSLVAKPLSLENAKKISLEKPNTPDFRLAYDEKGLDWQTLEPDRTKFSRDRIHQFLFNSDYYLAANLAFKTNLALTRFSPRFHDSAILDNNSNLVSDRNKDFKSLKIVIQNTTGNPILTKQVASYLRERGFKNIQIATSESFTLSSTTITTHSQNLVAANYIKTILSMGTLDLAKDPDFNEFTSSELLIQLGDDARFFARNHNFIYYEE